MGNEFGAVEALWSQFEGVMAKDTENGQQDEKENGGGGEDAGEDDDAEEGGEEGE